MNTTIGTAGNLELHDHNGMVEIIPVGEINYGMLTPLQAVQLITLLAKFLEPYLEPCD